MSDVTKLIFVAVASAVVGGLATYAGTKANPPPPSHRYSFRINLVDPNPGGPFQQPTQIDLPTGWDDRAPDTQQTAQPGTASTTVHMVPVILGEPAAHPHPEVPPDEDPGAHCHTWAFVMGAWRQVNCGG